MSVRKIFHGVVERTFAGATDQPDTRGRGERALLVLPLGFSAMVYFPVLGNYFFADDFLNLYNIANDSLLRYLVTPNGGHILVTRNAVFYVTARLFGTHPEVYQATMLLTHLVNVWLLFRLIHGLTASAWLASVGAGMWGTSPLHEGTLGWYSVYGHVLVATALLLILAGTTRAQRDGIPPPRGTLRRWWMLAIAAATSFGNGIAVAMALPFVLFMLLPEAPARRRPPLISLLVVVPVLYVAVMWLYRHLSGEHVAPQLVYGGLSAGAPRIIAFGMRLATFGLGRLALGFYAPSWLESVPFRAVLGALVGGAVVVGWRAPRPVKRQLVACVLLLAASYGMIAVGRAGLLADKPTQLINAFSRYHYVGQLVLAVTGCIVLGRAVSIRSLPLKSGLVLAWYAATAVAYACCAPPIDHHQGAHEQTEQALAAMRAQIEAQPPGAEVRIPNATFDPLPLPRTWFPGQAAAFTIFFPANIVEGRRVYFVEPNVTVRAQAQRGKRSATLFVPPAGDAGL